MGGGDRVSDPSPALPQFLLCLQDISHPHHRSSALGYTCGLSLNPQGALGPSETSFLQEVTFQLSGGVLGTSVFSLARSQKPEEPHYDQCGPCH